jgi:hypothetical protein
MLFAELGRGDAPNLFLRLDYDGSIHTNGGAFGRAFEEFGAIAGTAPATKLMERFLRKQNVTKEPLDEALAVALDAWAIGHLALNEEHDELPEVARVAAYRNEKLADTSIEAAVLERASTFPATWRPLQESDIRPTLEAR